MKKNNNKEREIEVGYKEKLFPHEHSWALEQITQDYSSTISILERFKSQSTSLRVADPILSRSLG